MNPFGSIQRKIVFWAGICLSLASFVIITYAATNLRATAITAAKQEAIAVAQEKAVGVNEEIEVALNTARTLAQTLSTTKDTETPLELSREQIIIILRKLLVDSPNLVGVYAIWEPDAFDEDDTLFQNEQGHDQDGRFVPYWSRNRAGTIVLGPRTADQTGEFGPYYQCAKQTRLECVTDPYHYPVQGEDRLLVSLSVPIIVEGRLYGVVGVDIGLEFFQSLADAVDIYDGTGRLVVITYEGILASVTNRPDLAGAFADTVHKDFETDAELTRIQQGTTIAEFNDENELEVFVPIYFWRILHPWSVSIIIPGEKIVHTADMLMWQMIGIGVGLTLVALVLLWVVARQITVPVKRVTAVASSVAKGNLDVEVVVQSRDETRVLADTFNQMIRNLRQTLESERKSLETLEEQYAEQKRLIELISALETPVIPIGDGVLLAPLVGTLDSRRAQNLTDRLLNEVYERHTRRVILDITGVLMIDTQVAHALIQTAQSLRLLGCAITITGISPVVATTITQLGINLTDVADMQSLEEILEHSNQHHHS